MNAAPKCNRSGTKGIDVLNLLFILIGFTACKHARVDPLAHGWKMVEVEPAPNALILQNAEASSCIWQTNQNGGQVTVSRVQGKFPQRHQEIRVETPKGL
jgi:hypothetical protein